MKFAGSIHRDRQGQDLEQDRGQDLDPGRHRAEQERLETERRDRQSNTAQSTTITEIKCSSTLAEF